MPDRVDALMDADQPAARDAIVDLVSRKPERGELPTPGHPFLPRRQPSKENVEICAIQPTGSTFSSNSKENVDRHRQNGRDSTFPVHPPTIPPESRQTRPTHTLSMRSSNEPAQTRYAISPNRCAFCTASARLRTDSFR
jgi:hypothetical protein